MNRVVDLSRRIVVIAALSLGMLWLAERAASACEITFDPDPVVIAAGGTAVVTVKIKWEHRRCVLDDDDVNVDGTKVKITKKTGWKKVRRGRFENKLTVKLTGDKGSIRVWRDCSKKGISEGKVVVKKK